MHLSVSNIPAVVVVGNTLAMEVREVFYTPAHRLGFWDVKLARRREREKTQEVAKQEAAFPAPTEAAFIETETRHPLEPLATSQQVGFDFGL